MAVAKNPVIQKAFEKGRSEGYRLGLQHGEQIGIERSTEFIADKFKKLFDTPGIGPKTAQKIVDAFGEEYFLNNGEKP